MENTLIKLKRLLNSIEDDELEDMDLWIDNEDKIDVIALDSNSITLITEEAELKINDKEW